MVLVHLALAGRSGGLLAAVSHAAKFVDYVITRESIIDQSKMGECISSIDNMVGKITGATVKTVTVGKADISIIKNNAFDSSPITLVVPLFDKMEVEPELIEIKDEEGKKKILEKLNKPLTEQATKDEIKAKGSKVVPASDMGLTLKNIIYIHVEAKMTAVRETYIASIIKVFQTAEQGKFGNLTFLKFSKKESIATTTDNQVAEFIWEACTSYLAKVPADSFHITDVSFTSKSEDYIKALGEAFKPLEAPAAPPKPKDP